MSWQTLTGAGGITVKYSTEEVERVKSQNENLLIENEQLRVEKESLIASRKVLKEQVLEKEQARQALLKKLNKSEINLKLETKARDGISKKVNKFEYEMLNYKDECTNMKEELSMLRVKVQELTYNLNQERSKRLRDIHEMDILKRRNTELEASNSSIGKENLAAQTSLYEKLEKMDTVMNHNESQKRVISSMGAEVNALNSEVAMVKEDLRRSQEAKYKFEQTLSLKDREREKLETEVFRLRKELIGFSGTHGQKQKAFELSGLRRPTATGDMFGGSGGLGTGNVSFDDPFAFAGGQLETSMTLGGGSAMPQHGRQLESSVVSDASAPYGFRSNDSRLGQSNDLHLPPAHKSPQRLSSTSAREGKRHRNAPFTAPFQSPNTEIRTSASTSEIMGRYVAPPPRASEPDSNHFLNTTREKSKSRSGKEFSLTPKSRFTGSGLGIRREETLEFQPSGSAKQIIDKVLKQQNKERGN